jgi:hypothetical protein
MRAEIHRMQVIMHFFTTQSWKVIPLPTHQRARVAQTV